MVPGEVVEVTILQLQSALLAFVPLLIFAVGFLLGRDFTLSRRVGTKHDLETLSRLLARSVELTHEKEAECSDLLKAEANLLEERERWIAENNHLRDCLRDLQDGPATVDSWSAT